MVDGRSPEEWAWGAVVAQPTLVGPSSLQWFLPILEADEAPLIEPLGQWVLQHVRKRDLRAYAKSLAEVVSTAPPGSPHEEPEMEDVISRSHASRIRIYRFEPSAEWGDLVGETYPDGFRRLFQIAGSKLDPEPEVVRLGVFEFDSGDVTSRYLGVTLRYPLGRASVDKPAWTVGDLLELNYQLAGPERGARPDESEDALHGTAAPTDEWVVSRGASSTDGAPTLPWKDFLRGVLASSATVEGRRVGPFVFDPGERPTCMTTIVAGGDLTRPDAIRVAEHLGASVQSVTPPNHPLGVHHGGQLPESLFERSDRVCYVVTQRAAGLVIYPGEEGGPHDTYLRRELPKEFQVQNPTLYLLALHQKRALDRIVDRLSAVELIQQSDGATQAVGDAKAVGDAPAQNFEQMQLQLAQIRSIQRSFYVLQAWTRYRLVSARFGHQGFYDLVCRQHRLDESYSDVDDILGGLEGYVRVQLSEYDQLRSKREAEEQRAFENRVQRYGFGFAVLTVILAILSINIRGLTADEGISGWGITAVLLVALAFLVVGMVATERRRRQSS